MKLAKFFAGFVIICIFTLFAVANLEKVQVNFLSENQPMFGYTKLDDPVQESGTAVKVPVQTPLFLVIYTAFGFGFLVSWLLSATLIRSHKRALKKLKKENTFLLKERDDLRNLPLNSNAESIQDGNEPDVPDTTVLPVK